MAEGLLSTGPTPSSLSLPPLLKETQLSQKKTVNTTEAINYDADTATHQRVEQTAKYCRTNYEADTAKHERTG